MAALSGLIIIIAVTTLVSIKVTQLQDFRRRIKVFFAGTQEIIKAGTLPDTQQNFLNVEKDLFEAERNRETDIVVAHCAYQRCVENANKCFSKNSFVLSALYLRKGSFEVTSGNLTEGDNDLHKSFVRPSNPRDVLIANMWLERILIDQNKTLEAIVLGGENMQMAIELSKQGLCERYLLIQTFAALAHNLDLANRSTEASPLWRQHLDLIKSEYGSSSAAYLQCSKNFAKHESARWFSP